MSRPDLDLSVYLVTDTDMTSRHGLHATVRAAVAGGVSVVQLRDPDAGDAEFVMLGRLVVSALRGSGVPLLVNDRVHLVAEIGADGAHVGQGDLDPVRAREQLGPAAYLGLSCSDRDEVGAALALPAGTLDYLGVGPVWATETKPGHGPPLGPDGVARLVQLAGTTPTVAIGGIDADRARSVVATGVHGVAVVSAVCAAEDPSAAARALRAAVVAGR
jgi:thiamine-phosphate pyrophosphorylase